MRVGSLVPDDKNRLRAVKFRELVTLFLNNEGIPVEQRKNAFKLSERFAEDYPASHLTGLARWAVMTRNERTLDLSGALDAATAAARQDKKELAAVVAYRAARPVSEAYVSMTFDTFAKVLRSEQEHAH